MEQDQSLDGIISQAHMLMKTTKKKLAELPEDTLLDFFHAVETQTIQKTYELASILGFYKIKSVKLVCFKKISRLGICNSSGDIKIDFKTFFGYDYNGVISVIVHELCHTNQLNHTKEFWTLFEQSCRKIGVLPSEYDGWTKCTKIDDPFMYILPWEYHKHPQKYKIIREKICWSRSYWGEYLIRVKSHQSLINDKVKKSHN